jgi:hypothetical protein
MQWKTLTSVVKEDRDRDEVAIPRGLFRHLLIAALRHKGVFDEDYYKSSNKDVTEAIAKGVIASAADHYYKAGYFEGRQPKYFVVDEKYYLENNADVIRGIRSGIITSAQQHFDNCGFKEGRSPYADFLLY